MDAAVAPLPAVTEAGELCCSNAKLGEAEFRIDGTPRANVCIDAELLEAAGAFFDRSGSLTFTNTRGSAAGFNNRVFFVDGPTGARTHVLRIYNNGGNDARVAFEVAVLRALDDHGLPFALPSLVPTLADPTACTVRLGSGARACAFRHIPGATPDPSCPHAAAAIGRATAQLVAVMRDRVTPATVGLSPNPLYRDVYAAHPCIGGTRAGFDAAVSSAAFEPVRALMPHLVAEVDAAAAIVDAIAALRPAAALPVQAINADLHYDNALLLPLPSPAPPSCAASPPPAGAAADGGGWCVVSGLLDFEFTAHDWRAMELVVGISKYVAAGAHAPTGGGGDGDADDIDGGRALMAAWLGGYAAGGGALTASEVAFLPGLLHLRMVSNIVYYIGRVAAGEEEARVLAERGPTYIRRCAWLRDHGSWLTGVAGRLLLQMPDAHGEAAVGGGGSGSAAGGVV